MVISFFQNRNFMFYYLTFPEKDGKEPFHVFTTRQKRIGSKGDKNKIQWWRI
jgi:hypothetical protein